VAGAHQIAAQILTRPDEIAQASSYGAGTSTGRSRPAASNRASFNASLVSVLMRSPG
jgi:hypothetical protein